MSAVMYVSHTLPWDPLPGENKRLRRLMFIMLGLALFIRIVVPFIPQPKVDRAREEAIPEHLAQVILERKQEVVPPPVIRPKVQKKVKISEDLRPREPKVVEGTRPHSTATASEKQAARERAETKGVLAFKDSFSDMLDEDEGGGGGGAPSRLGADARVSNSGKTATGNGGGGQRNLITSANGSGGIGNIGASRGYGTGSGGGTGSGSGDGIGGNGKAISGAGVKVAKVSSGIGTGTGNGHGAGRPLSSGSGPARTDEEIQIVFDKYKSALYRIYNRELRNDPSLRGKMVLAITIEPDGHVSACKVQSTDMDSQALAADVVDRVMKFSFGAKEGVPTTRIVYPIDFLPSA